MFIYHVSFVYHVLEHLIIYNDYPLNDLWKIILALNHTKVMEDVSFTFPSIRIYTFGRFPSVSVSSSSLIQYWVEQQERSWRERNEAGRGRNEEAGSMSKHKKLEINRKLISDSIQGLNSAPHQLRWRLSVLLFTLGRYKPAGYYGMDKVNNFSSSRTCLPL